MKRRLREIYLRSRHVVRSRKLSLSDEARAQIAIKTFRFYSRTRPQGRKVLREKANRLFKDI